MVRSPTLSIELTDASNRIPSHCPLDKPQFPQNSAVTHQTPTKSISTGIQKTFLKLTGLMFFGLVLLFRLKLSPLEGMGFG